VKIITRAAWHARPPRSTSYLASARGMKIHYVGEHVPITLADHHDQCTSLVQGIQREHMNRTDPEPWADIGYNALVCPHGYVYVGRGPHRLPAANGPGLNSGHYAVCGLVGDSGLVVPPAAMLDGLRDAIEWLRRTGAAGTEIKGHRDGYATSCPGDRLYRWVCAGAPRPGDHPAPGSTWTEDLVEQLPTLRRGDRGEHVESVQGLLQARSHLEVKIDGSFGSATENAVRAVQRWGDVDDDGICGPATWPVLLRVQ